MDEAMRGIEALRRRDEAASKAYDVKALAELWTPDAVALPPGGPLKRGPELRRGLEKMAEAARGTEVLDYREVFEETLVFGDTVTYRGLMFTGVPNLAWVFGYIRAAWTLRAVRGIGWRGYRAEGRASTEISDVPVCVSTEISDVPVCVSSITSGAVQEACRA